MAGAGETALTLSTGRTVRDRLAQARRQRFIGRAAELDLLRSLLEEAGSGAVLFVHGPGGVGKTALLGRFIDLAHALAWPPYGSTPARWSRRLQHFS